MIGRLLCLLGFHDWVLMQWIRYLSAYRQRCARPGCPARRIAL